MNGRELLLSAVRNEVTPRPPWLPFVGAHGAFLIDKTATEYLNSAELIVEGLLKARELYQPDGLPIVFDLQMEAEALGCELHWADDGPPSVRTHPLDDGSHYLMLPDFDVNAGRIPLAMEATRRMKAEVGDEIALYGLICGPFTLALHLLGNNIFLEMFDNADQIAELVSYCASIGKKMADAYIDAGCDVIAVVDPMISQISAAHFQRFVTPAVNDLCDHIRDREVYSSLFCCGDASRNIEVMCQTTCDGISVDENVDLAFVRKTAGLYDKSFGGNLQLTVVLLLGSEAETCRHTIDIIDQGGTKGFILAPGCDLSYHTPADNLAAVGRMAHDEQARLDAMAQVAQTTADTFDDIELTDYEHEKITYIDLITLDSSTCAPCQYMKEAADKAAAEFGDAVIVREFKVKNRIGLGMMCLLGATNIPTLCIDGVPRFASIIPDQKTLVEAIRQQVNRKISS